MKTIKKIILLIVFSLFMIGISSKVNAASANLTSNKTSMEVGESATIKVTVKAASWNVKVSGPATINEADTSSDGENTTKTFTTSFKPSKAGSYKFTLSGDITDGDTMNTQSISGNLTIKVTEEEDDDDSDDNRSSSTSKQENKVSSDATLRNLGITPNDFSGFKKTKTSYNVTVPNSTEKINIYAKTTDSKATVTGTGSKTLKEGSNSFSVKVTAADKKTTKTYTLNITRKSEDKKESDEKEDKEDSESKEETKPALGIYKLSLTGVGDDNITEEIELNKEFDRGNFEYSCDVSEKIKKILVNAEAYEYNDSIKITGNENELKDGENVITVSVSDDKDTVKYTIKVNKGKNKIEENTQVQAQETEASKNNNTKNNMIIVIGIIVVLAIIVALIAFYIKKNKNRE